MWAITSYYNPARYKCRLANYRIFRKNLITPLVTVELSFDGKFELTEGDADILIQISGGAVLWQKERLLNVAIKSVPPNVDSIAWVDCDVIFERSNWIAEPQNTRGQIGAVRAYPYSSVITRSHQSPNMTASRAAHSRSGRSLANLQVEDYNNRLGSEESRHAPPPP